MATQYPDIEKLEPRLFWKHFCRLIAIPRGSGNEAAVREYALAFARENGIEPRVDGVGNVVIPIPATRGYEHVPTIVLQGHLDIVCEKRSEFPHDFEKDPIPAFVDGDYLRTRGTTLGGDNGAGVAAGLALVEDKDSVHGSLEILLTVDEETGMTGAFGLGQGYPGGAGAFVTGRRMANLDSEDEGVFFVGCAGGADTTIIIKAQRNGGLMTGFVPVQVKVSGLKGGHSGLDIDKGRGNALRILALAIAAGAPPDLEKVFFGSITGGAKRNAIPRDAEGLVFVHGDEVANFAERVAEFTSKTRNALGKGDPDLQIAVEQIETGLLPLWHENGVALLRLLLGLPHGPLVMSRDIPGMVETSTNLSMVEMGVKDGVPVFFVRCLSRSSIESELDATTLQIRSLAALLDPGLVSSIETSGKYPGWKPNMDSPFLAQARQCYWEFTKGKEPTVTCIHAGLECGVIGEQIPDMDMISFGPEMHAVHSPDEHLSVPSSRRFYDFLKALLADQAKQAV